MPKHIFTASLYGVWVPLSYTLKWNANGGTGAPNDTYIKLWGDGLYHERWYVCVNAVAPAILIEHGFHTNKAEQFLTVFTVIIAFYFGTQAQKVADENKGE